MASMWITDAIIKKSAELSAGDRSHKLPSIDLDTLPENEQKKLQAELRKIK